MRPHYTVLNSISNTLFSIDLAQYDSNLSQEFRDLVCGLAKEAGRPNIADYFPVLRLIDPQGVRKRTRIYYSKLLAIFDGIINQRLQLRASSKGSKESNNTLDSLLNLIKEDNSEISLLGIKHLLLASIQVGNACWELYCLEHGIQVGNACWELYCLEHGIQVQDLMVQLCKTCCVLEVNISMTPIDSNTPTASGISSDVAVAAAIKMGNGLSDRKVIVLL
nr:geraniol 8-hydroxylase [Quercus suber]